MATAVALNTSNGHSPGPARLSVRGYGIATAAAWTLATVASLTWNLSDLEATARTFAAVQARASFAKDVAYRRWVAEKGGVYAAVSAATPPNPYLKDNPRRDIALPDGQTLTLINPAYMSRQVFEIYDQDAGSRSHITSLKPLRPENGPDPWEGAALHRLSAGEADVLDFTTIDGKPTLRFMGRFITGKGCLPCHGFQGYAEGDVRGGISITVPLQPYLVAASLQRRHLLQAHVGIWLLGLLGLGFGGRRLHQRVLAQQAAQEALLAAEHRLDHARRLEAVGQLAGGVAHDLNNLLMPILGHTSLALDSLPAADPLRTDLEAVRHAAERARDLTRGLLAFGRKQRLERRTVDPSSALTNILPMLRKVVGERVRVVTQLAPALPTIEVDLGLLEVALVNLAANARDAMPRGGNLVLATRLAPAGPAADPTRAPQFVEICVSDDGDGMSNEVKAHLFEPFYTTKPVGKGTGLGLASVHGTVAQHGGTINVDSEPGKGTVFRLLFPVATHKDVSPTATAPAPRGCEEVLIVEDDVAVRRFLARALGGLGYRVIEASGAPEALELVKDAGRDLRLVVTDVVMPGPSGIELGRALKKLRPPLPVVYISGYPRDALGGDDNTDGIEVLAKPFGADDLARVVRRALDRAAT
jgi:signal transduction histidine kinase/ActR/RegA family two-component response regulator